MDDYYQREKEVEKERTREKKKIALADVKTNQKKILKDYNMDYLHYRIRSTDGHSGGAGGEGGADENEDKVHKDILSGMDTSREVLAGAIKYIADEQKHEAEKLLGTGGSSKGSLKSGSKAGGGGTNSVSGSVRSVRSRDQMTNLERSLPGFPVKDHDPDFSNDMPGTSLLQEVYELLDDDGGDDGKMTKMGGRMANGEWYKGSGRPVEGMPLLDVEVEHERRRRLAKEHKALLERERLVGFFHVLRVPVL